MLQSCSGVHCSLRHLGLHTSGRRVSSGIRRGRDFWLHWCDWAIFRSGSGGVEQSCKAYAGCYNLRPRHSGFGCNCGKSSRWLSQRECGSLQHLQRGRRLAKPCCLAGTCHQLHQFWNWRAQTGALLLCSRRWCRARRGRDSGSGSRNSSSRWWRSRRRRSFSYGSYAASFVGSVRSHPKDYSLACTTG